MSLEKIKNLNQLNLKIEPLKRRAMTIIALAHRGYLANLRNARAHTKTRGEISGGGRKPWRQKGTGRARVGSIRSPLWRGGGTVFGPTKWRNFTQKLNRKFKHRALSLALQDKLNQNNIWQIDQWPTDGKTKTLAAIIKDLKRPVLIVASKLGTELKRAGSNLDKVHLAQSNSLSALPVIAAENLIIDSSTIKILKEKLARLNKSVQKNVITPETSTEHKPKNKIIKKKFQTTKAKTTKK